MAQENTLAEYQGPIELGMVFDLEPGKKHVYERLTVTRKEGNNIWCYGRAGETYHEESAFRKRVVFVSPTPIVKKRPVPVPLNGRYEGPIELGMKFDLEPAKKHVYERLTVTRKEGNNIWCYGRAGETYHEESIFRDRVAVVPPELAKA